jgi:diguanylate cyclase (GGDEF)-like protein
MRKMDREAFLRDLGKAITRCNTEDHRIGLVVVQVAQLDKVEGAFGYEKSHGLLDEFCVRMESLLRIHDRFIEIGDRKFCFILNEIKNEGHAILAASKIERLTNKPFTIDGRAVKLDASIGIAVFPNHATNAEELARRAEHALAASQDEGTPYEIYADGSTMKMATLWHMESELGTAVEQNELELYYQPKISLQTGRPCGAEALMRWNHPTRGLIFPDVFIPVADRTGYLEPMTWFAINTALRQQAEWSDLWGKLSVSINLSASVLQSEQLTITIQDAAKIWGSDPQYLILEITEDALITDPDQAFAILRQLRSDGIRISIDDFGTGYSSMAHFRDMPADELKIDKSFVLNMLNDNRDRQIVRTSIDLAHTFDFAVVAEGVETAAILKDLINLNCDIAQGFLYAKALPQQEFIRWLERYRPGDYVQDDLVHDDALALVTDKK